MAAIMEQLLQMRDRGHALSSELAEIVANIQQSVVLVRGRRGSGSGVVWDSSGSIITNAHVVHEPNAEVVFANGDRFAARVSDRSERLDLAVLTPDGADDYDWPVVTVRDSAEMRAGELVLAVGNPMGERNVATMGMLVAPPAPPAGNLRAAITLRPGNSGGAMADAEGRVVGIPHIVMGGGLAQAVSSRAVQRFLRRDGNRRKPLLGVTGHWVEIPEAIRIQNDLIADAGLLIAEVSPGGVADRAGVVLGDILVGFSKDTGHPSALVGLNDFVGDNPGASRLALIRGGRLRWTEVDSAA